MRKYVLFLTIIFYSMMVKGQNNAPLLTIINAYNMILRSQLSIIPNTGHPVFLENFAAVWTSIVPFLKE